METRLLALLSMLLPLPALASPGDDGIPYAELARALLADAGLEAGAPAESVPEGSGLDELLAGGFLSCELGLFDLYVSYRSLEESEQADSFRLVALALLDAQKVWLGWLGSAGESNPTAKDLATVRSWVATWKPGNLDSSGAGGSAIELLEPNEAITTASREFAQAMRSGAALGLERDAEIPEGIVFCPTRADFVSFLCTSAWLRPQDRAALHSPQIIDWTYCYVDRWKVLAGEMPAPGRAEGDWQSGTSMSARSPTGMQQQIVQLSANSLFDNYFGERIPPSLAGALSINLVIDVFGACDTRVDGDLRERRTMAREIFVPGGMSEGGRLPPNWADSKWRTGAGVDHFVSALKTAQSAGHKEKQDKQQAWFILQDEGSSTRAAVRAPFLGSAASMEKLDPRLDGDRLDFLRSYRVAFVWWLQNESESSSKKAREQFAALLRALAATGDGDVETAFRSTCGGRALSSAELGKDDLEGRFLEWLSKQ